MIHHAQVAPAHGIAPLRRPAVQLHGLFQVLFHPLAAFIAHAQVAQSRGIVLLGGFLIQAAGPVLVLLHAEAVVVADTQPVKARRVVRSRLGKPPEGLSRVLGLAADAIQAVHAHLHHGVGVAVLRRLADVLQGLTPAVRQLQKLRGKDHDLGVLGVLGILLKLFVVRHLYRSLSND